MSSRASRRTSTRQAASASVERHADGAAADAAAGGRSSHNKRRRGHTKVDEEGEEQNEDESEEQQQDDEEGDSSMQTDGAAAASPQDEEDEQRARKKASRSHPRDQPTDESQPQLLSDRTPTHSRTASRQQQQQQSPLYDGAIESARYGASPLLRVSRLAEKAELAELNKRLELYILRQRERDAAQTGLDREIALLRSKFIAESAQDKKRHEARYDELKKQKVRTHAGISETNKREWGWDGMGELQ